MLKKSLMLSVVALVLISCGSDSSSDDKKLGAPDLNITDYNNDDEINIPDLNKSSFDTDEISSPDLNKSSFDTDEISSPDLNTTDFNNNNDDKNTSVPDLNATNFDSTDTNIPDLNTTNFSSTDTTIPDLTDLKTGYLVDAPVEGVAYTCAEIEGFTTNKGEFSCVDAPVEFSIGSYNLGKLDDFTSDGIVYPQDLIEGLNRNDIDDEKVINMIQLLQSLDDDGDISEIIKIDENVANKFEQFGESTNSLSLDELVNLADKDMVDKEGAIEHFIENILGNQ